MTHVTQFLVKKMHSKLGRIEEKTDQDPNWKINADSTLWATKWKVMKEPFDEDFLWYHDRPRATVSMYTESLSRRVSSRRNISTTLLNCYISKASFADIFSWICWHNRFQIEKHPGVTEMIPESLENSQAQKNVSGTVSQVSTLHRKWKEKHQPNQT